MPGSQTARHQPRDGSQWGCVRVAQQPVPSLSGLQLRGTPLPGSPPFSCLSFGYNITAKKEAEEIPQMGGAWCSGFQAISLRAVAAGMCLPLQSPIICKCSFLCLHTHPIDISGTQKDVWKSTSKRLGSATPPWSLLLVVVGVVFFFSRTNSNQWFPHCSEALRE